MAEIMTPNGLVVGLIVEAAEKPAEPEVKKPAGKTGRQPRSK